MYQLDEDTLAALRAGQYVVAADLAQQSIALGQDSGLAQEYLAAALNAQGKTQEALQAYKQIAYAGDTASFNLVPYAQLLLKSGRWAEAAVIYNRVLPALSSNSHPLMEGPFSPAVPQAEELEVALHIARGLAISPWGKPSPREEAFAEFIQAAKLAPDSPLTNYYFGYGWQCLPLKSKAKALYAARAKAAYQKAALLGGDAVKRSAEAELSRIKTDEASQSK